MPDPRKFLDRWARLKRAGETPSQPEPAVEEEPSDVAPGDLPRVEDLEAGSDFTAFLRPNVPAALRRAALRQAWTVTPAIKGHKPLVDYDWDFNAPGAFRLTAADDPAELIARLFSPRPQEAVHASSSPAEPPEGADGATVDEAEPDGAEPTGNGLS